MNETNHCVDLIVSEMEIDANNSFDGINLIKLVKTKKSSIPVVMLTSIGRREVITQCLKEGAADYILKPFKDDNLKERLLKYINLESLTESTIINFNLKNFLDGEIYKAKKGKYPFSHYPCLCYLSGKRNGNPGASQCSHRKKQRQKLIEILQDKLRLTRDGFPRFFISFIAYGYNIHF